MKKKFIGLYLVLLMFSINTLAQKTENRIESISHTNVLAFKTKTPTLKLDSLVTKDSAEINSQKNEYAYDSRGNQILIQNCVWDKTNSNWRNYSKQEFAYDNNNLTLRTYYRWNTTENKWIGDKKYEYAYDNNDNQILGVAYDWNRTTNTWIGISKSQYNYDSNAKEILCFTDYWSATENSWVKSYKVERSYDNQGHPALSFRYRWDKTSNVWVGAFKSEYVYDGKGNLISSISYDGETNNTWVGSSKYEYTFDENNNKTLSIFSMWYKDVNAWIAILKYEYIYDIQNLLVAENSHNWVRSVDMWIPDLKIEYINDDNRNRTDKIVESWDVMTYTWKMSYKFDYTYDNNISATSLNQTKYVNNFLEVITTNNIPINAKRYYWDSKKQQWEEYNMFEKRYYSPISLTSLTEPAENNIKIYPNPVIDVLQINNIQGELNVKLYNLQGILLRQTNQNTLDFSDYKAGIYLLDVNGQIKKIVKK